MLPTENAGAPEIYVDQIEALACVVAPSGTPIVARCQGTLQMKSYVAHETLRAALKLQPFRCAELTAGYPFMAGAAGAGASLDDMQLHQQAELQPERAFRRRQSHASAHGVFEAPRCKLAGCRTSALCSHISSLPGLVML